ncbi:uncharacterized protein Bfra_006411 [Botrytis fragariae]|uniref:Uncharacterized protein n=1 Tax=Botrytis fragariae TaxID=1964551 RepID=A0A8H6B4D9_9HELO|nr:uncharacterized protein Bfra_006411 [Botrytis fragariae]KAF5879206.1 hypothetical protein Bfra_006411 [Botrytis fragariae]
MPLLALSNELLNAILEFSDFSGSRELCKTCHLLNELATRYLYSTITFDDKIEEICPKDPCHYLFLRTIVNRPDLAKFSKIFQCTWLLRAELEKIWRLFYPHLDDESDPATGLWTLIRIKVNEASASSKQAKLWHTGIFGLGNSRTPGSDGILALIVCLLTNLKEIHMSEGNFKRGGNAGTIDPTAEFFAPMFAHAVALQTKQRALEHEISPYSMSELTFMSIKNISHDHVPLSKIVQRLELPSLKKFVVQDAYDLFPKAPFSIPETFTSRVQDLQFERSVFHPENLRRLLSACPSLRRFALEHSSISAPFCSTEMINGLMASKETLEFIEAGVASEYIRPHLVDTGSFGRPGSFANFPKLKEIVVSAGVILDDSINKNTSAETDSGDDTDADHTRAFLQRIPRSLQNLTLKDCYSFDHTTFTAVLALVREKERYAPDLKYISLTWRGIHSSEHRLGKNDLIKACKEAGIELGVYFKHYYL